MIKCRRCKAEFLPSRRGIVYCSRECANKDKLRYSPSQITQLAALILEGASVGEIEFKVGIKPTETWRLLRSQSAYNLGIGAAAIDRWKQKWRRDSRDRTNEIIRLRLLGHTWAEIARKCGMSRQGVCSVYYRARGNV